MAVVAGVVTVVLTGPIGAGAAPDPSAPPGESETPGRANVQREVCTVPGLDRAHGPTQLAGLDLPAVWALTRGDGQRVAVIGTGVATHRRLPRLVGGGDFVSDGDGRRDCDGSGTLIAGIVAAAPDSGADGFSGVAPLSTVIAIRQRSAKFASDGDPAARRGDASSLAHAVRTAADQQATVIVIGACLSADIGGHDLGAALHHAVNVRNAVVITAVGDTDEPCAPDFAGGPILDGGVLTVGSVDDQGTTSRFTRTDRPVDINAPGEGVFSLSPVGDSVANTVAIGDTADIHGTVYAAAVVGGVAALVRSRFPELTARQVRHRLIATARYPTGARNGAIRAGVAGVVDPVAAVSALWPPTRDTAGTRGAPDTQPSITAQPPAARATDKNIGGTPEAAQHGNGRTALIGAGALLAVMGVGRVLQGSVRNRATRPGPHRG